MQENGAGKKYVYLNGARFEVTESGLLYDPERRGSCRKHPCPDCLSCAWCASTRCSLCLKDKMKEEIKP